MNAVDKEGYSTAMESGYAVTVPTDISADLLDEGLAREIVHRLQTMRRNAGFDIADRIVTYYQDDADIRRVMTNFDAYIRQETLSVDLLAEEPPAECAPRRAGGRRTHDMVGGAKGLKPPLGKPSRGLNTRPRDCFVDWRWNAYITFPELVLSSAWRSDQASRSSWASPWLRTRRHPDRRPRGR